jgi:hypothetical protein
VLSAVVVVMAIMMFFIYQKYIRSDELKILVHGNRVVNMVADNINEISIVGSGYSQYFTLPDSLYGGRNYTISFFQNESTIYLQGGSFVRGIELVLSVPVSTIKVDCLSAQCNAGCNKTPTDFCLKVNETMDLRVTNEDGIIYLTYPYNLKQGSEAYYVVPLSGNRTYNNASCMRGSFFYVYRNSDDGTTNLVFQHNSSVNSMVKLNFSEMIGDLNVTVSDDAGELNVSSAYWNLTRDQCDGGVINFKEGVHLCIKPVFQDTLNWTWLNGDNTWIALNETKTVCLSYP